jgi:hypothetical protein
MSSKIEISPSEALDIESHNLECIEEFNQHIKWFACLIAKKTLTGKVSFDLEIPDSIPLFSEVIQKEIIKMYKGFVDGDKIEPFSDITKLRNEEAIIYSKIKEKASVLFLTACPKANLGAATMYGDNHLNSVRFPVSCIKELIMWYQRLLPVFGYIICYNWNVTCEKHDDNVIVLDITLSSNEMSHPVLSIENEKISRERYFSCNDDAIHVRLYRPAVYCGLVTIMFKAFQEGYMFALKAKLEHTGPFVTEEESEKFIEKQTERAYATLYHKVSDALGPDNRSLLESFLNN